MNLTEYRQAIIHLAWFRDDNVHHLLFGMVELRPTEFPDAIGCLQKDFRAKNRTRKYLHYRRFVLSVADAIDWYQNATDGNLILLHDSNHPAPGDGEKLEGGPFILEPPWPHLVTSNELAFAPDWMQDSRTHCLFPKNVLSEKISEIIRIDKNWAKLKEWLNFDIVEAYREYQGAICLVAPNPLFRSIEKFRCEQTTEGMAETVAYKLVARQGQRLNGLRLEIVNERLLGRMVPLVHDFGDDAIAEFNFPANVYKEGLAITHPEYGLLAWHEPLRVRRAIHMKMELHRRDKTVRVPADGHKRPEYEYEVNEVEDEREIVVGDSLDDTDIVSRVTEAENRRSRKQAAKDYDQQWFHREPIEAVQYVQKKIGEAHDMVLIVDPYFAGRELFEFGHAIRRQEVQLRILTSAQSLKKGGSGESNRKPGSQLLKILNDTFKVEDYSKKPEIRILTGESPSVHDRFLVVDGSVWLSGNSLHRIGERAGMILRLPDPEPVIELLEDFWYRAPTLSDWLSNQPAPDTSWKKTLRAWVNRLMGLILRR